MKKSIVFLALLTCSLASAHEGVKAPASGIFHEVYDGDRSLLICSISEEGVSFTERTGSDPETGDWKEVLNLSYRLPKAKWAALLKEVEEASGHPVVQGAPRKAGATTSTQGFISGKRFYLNASLDGVASYDSESPNRFKLMARIREYCSMKGPLRAQRASSLVSSL